MKNKVIIMVVGILIPLCGSAQLGKQMTKYHGKSGITVTRLDKSLYGLYQRENLSTENKEMLQKLDEVNILNLNTKDCDEGVVRKLTAQFQEELEKPEKYKLVKSRNDSSGKQLIYTQNKNDKISDLVVWNEGNGYVDIIELRGDIRLDRIASLSRALNLDGLRSLATLSSGSRGGQEAQQKASLADAMNMIQQLEGGLISGFDQLLGHLSDSSDRERSDSLNPFARFESMMRGLHGLNPDDLMAGENAFHQMEKFLESFDNGSNVVSNSVKITEENGKTKLKIDTKNSDVTYVIDGKEMPKDNLQMPDKIMNVNIIPSREDMKKSYIFLTSKNKLGYFISYKEGVLVFKYDNQEYRYNLERTQEPLLVVNGRLTSLFRIEPAHILQIRPISQIEKKVGYYPNAEVIINTK